MTKITWDEDTKRLYETGTDNVVLYVKDSTGKYGKGEGWDGVTGISENPDGATTTTKYANNGKYGNLVSEENFKFTIAAFTNPVSFEACDGSASPAAAKGVYVTGQDRKQFGLTYRTKIGNDTEGNSLGYTIHIVYSATAAPSKRDYTTINESPDMMGLSWDATTVNTAVPGMKPTAHIRIKSTEADPGALAKLEAKLYGAGEPAADASLPTPDEVFTIMGVQA